MLTAWRSEPISSSSCAVSSAPEKAAQCKQMFSSWETQWKTWRNQSNYRKTVPCVSKRLQRSSSLYDISNRTKCGGTSSQRHQFSSAPQCYFSSMGECPYLSHIALYKTRSQPHYPPPHPPHPLVLPSNTMAPWGREKASIANLDF